MKIKDSLLGLVLVATACQYEKGVVNNPEIKIVTMNNRDEMRRVFEALYTRYLNSRETSPITIEQEKKLSSEAVEEINLLKQTIDESLNYLKACIDAPNNTISCDPIEEALKIIGLSSSLLKITEAIYGEGDELERVTHYVKKIHATALRVLKTGNYSE